MRFLLHWKHQPPNHHFCLHHCPENTTSPLVSIPFWDCVTEESYITSSCHITHISAHAVLVFHFAFLGVQAIIRGAAVFLAGCAQAVWWRNRVVLRRRKKGNIKVCQQTADFNPTHSSIQADLWVVLTVFCSTRPQIALKISCRPHQLLSTQYI